MNPPPSRSSELTPIAAGLQAGWIRDQSATPRDASRVISRHRTAAMTFRLAASAERGAGAKTGAGRGGIRRAASVVVSFGFAHPPTGPPHGPAEIILRPARFGAGRELGRAPGRAISL